MPPANILLGVIGRPHGVRGLVRIVSYTDPPDAIAEYGPLADERGRRFALRWGGDGLAEIAEIVDGRERRVADRTEAARLTNTRLFVERERLPATEEDEFYLADLVGLTAVDAAGATLGTVAAVHDYGAGASLEIGPLVVPFTRAAVPEVDVAGGRIVVAPPVAVDAEPSPAAQKRGDLSRSAGEVSFPVTSPACGRGRRDEGAPGEGSPQ
jgi:16S rRNA processing protein RimM